MIELLEKANKSVMTMFDLAPDHLKVELLESTKKKAEMYEASASLATFLKEVQDGTVH